MKLQTQFEIGDTAYELSGGECFRVLIKEIDVEVTKDKGVTIDYLVVKYIPEGLLKERESEVEINQDLLFLSKQEVKDKLKEIEEANEKVEELAKFSISKGQRITELARDYAYMPTAAAGLSNW